MEKDQFNQYMKVLDECQKLFELCGTPYLDEISSSLTNEQFQQSHKHPARDVLQI